MPDTLCRRSQCWQPPRQGSAAENPPIPLQQPQPPGQACYFTPKNLPIALLFIITFHSTLAIESMYIISKRIPDQSLKLIWALPGLISDIGI